MRVLVLCISVQPSGYICLSACPCPPSVHVLPVNVRFPVCFDNCCALLNNPLFIPSLFIAEVACANSHLFQSFLPKPSSFCIHLWFLKLNYQQHLTFQSSPSIAVAYVTHMHQSFIPVTTYSCTFPKSLPFYFHS